MTKPQILIVDDNQDIADNLREILELEGYEVATAADGFQALFALDGKLRPALIVLDLMMPDMDGVTFRREQKRRAPEVAGIPVVGWSAFDHLRAPDFEVIPKTDEGYQRLRSRVREVAPLPPAKPRISTRRLGIIAAIVASLATLIKTIVDHWPIKKGHP